MESKDEALANGEPAIREELDIQHPASTTIGTIVVQGGPLQLVIAVLQVSFGATFFYNRTAMKKISD